MEQNSRTVLMKRLQICDFVLVETKLYLDSHPNDAAALAFWNKYRVLRDQTCCEYTERFGPVLPPEQVGEHWCWIDGPWPWEGMED